MALQKNGSHLQTRTPTKSEKNKNASEETSAKGKLPRTSSESSDAPSAALKRELGLFSATAVVIGSVIGTGIFVSPNLVLAYSGSIGADLLIWVGAGAMAIIQAMCMAELGALIPASGGDYAFLCAAGDTLGRPGDFVSFLYAWCRILVADPLGGTLQGLAFATYALRLVYPSCEPPYSVTALVAFAFCAVATALNGVSLGMSSKLQNALVVSKILLLLSIVGTAVIVAFTGTNYFRSPYFSSDTTVGGLANAYFAAYVTTEGGASVCYIGEEVKNPARILPWALFLGMLTVASLYILTNIAYFIVLGTNEILASEAVALTFGVESWGTAGAVIMPIVVSVSAFGTLSAGFFSNSRLAFAAARKGHLPFFLSLVSVKTSVPTASLFLRGAIASALNLIGSLRAAVNIYMLFTAIFNMLTMLALVRLRFTMKHAPRTIKVPYIFVALTFLVNLGAVVLGFMQSTDYIIIVVVGGVLVSGVIVYFVFHVFKCALPGSRSVSLFVQKLCLCQPCIKLDA
ncbi:b(0,+)-type amino acid transporter 1-like isoform X1 [Haemaphysalis longicornis]